MEPLSLDQVFCRVKDCLAPSHHSLGWKVEKIDAQNIIVIRKIDVASMTFSIDNEIERLQIYPSSHVAQLNDTPTQQISPVKVEEPWTDHLDLNTLVEFECKKETRSTVGILTSRDEEGQKEHHGEAIQEGQVDREKQQDIDEKLNSSDITDVEDLLDRQQDGAGGDNQYSGHLKRRSDNEEELSDVEQGYGGVVKEEGQDEEKPDEESLDGDGVQELNYHEFYLNVKMAGPDDETVKRDREEEQPEGGGPYGVKKEQNDKEKKEPLAGEKELDAEDQVSNELIGVQRSDSGCFNCPKCSVTCKYRKDLVGHYCREHHGTDRRQNCSGRCGLMKRITKESQYPELFSVRRSDSGCFNCPRCSLTYKYRKDLVSHYGRKHHEKNEKRTMEKRKKDRQNLLDDRCGLMKRMKRIKKESQYPELLSVRRSDSGQFNCPRCSSTYKYRKDLVAHYGRKHHGKLEIRGMEKEGKEETDGEKSFGATVGVEEQTNYEQCLAEEIQGPNKKKAEPDGDEDEPDGEGWSHREKEKRNDRDQKEPHDQEKVPDGENLILKEVKGGLMCSRWNGLRKKITKESKYPELLSVRRADSGRFKCPRCSLTYKYRKDLTFHYRRKHHGEGEKRKMEKRRQNCSGRSEQKRQRITQMSMCPELRSVRRSDNGHFNCPRCSWMCKYWKDLVRHYCQKHHGDGQNCSGLCRLMKRITKESQYPELVSVRRSDSGRFNCPRCSLTYKYRKDLVSHYGRKHHGKDEIRRNEEKEKKETDIVKPFGAIVGVEEQNNYEHYLEEIEAADIAKAWPDRDEDKPDGEGSSDREKEERHDADRKKLHELVKEPDRENLALKRLKGGLKCLGQSGLMKKITKKIKYPELLSVKTSDSGRFNCPKCTLTYKYRKDLVFHFGRKHCNLKSSLEPNCDIGPSEAVAFGLLDVDQDQEGKEFWVVNVKEEDEKRTGGMRPIGSLDGVEGQNHLEHYQDKEMEGPDCERAEPDRDEADLGGEGMSIRQKSDGVKEKHVQRLKRVKGGLKFPELISVRKSDSGRFNCPKCSLTYKYRKDLVFHYGRKHHGQDKVGDKYLPTEPYCDKSLPETHGFEVPDVDQDGEAEGLDKGELDGERRSDAFDAVEGQNNNWNYVDEEEKGLNSKEAEQDVDEEKPDGEARTKREKKESHEKEKEPNGEDQVSNGVKQGDICQKGQMKKMIKDSKYHSRYESLSTQPCCDSLPETDVLENTVSLDRHNQNESSFKVTYGNVGKLTNSNGSCNAPKGVKDKKKKSSEGLFKCPQCALTFKARARLRQHCRTVHHFELDAGENLSNYPELKDVKVAESGRLICPCCPLTLKGPAGLLDHYKSVHLDKKTHVKLKHTRRSLSALAFVKTSEDGLMHCPKCTLAFKTRDYLGRHFSEVHENHHDYECPVCHLKFKTRSTAQFHREMIHNDGTGNLLCHLCDMRFYQSCYLNRHIKTFHGKGVTCSQCNAKFSTHLQLKKHRSVSHVNEDFRCDFCKESFLSLKRLENHLEKIHPDAEPVNICSYCQKSFSAAQQLSYHIDEFHEHDSKHLDKPFACSDDLCGKRFCLESSLSQHASLHVPHLRPCARRKAKQINEDKNREDSATIAVENESPCPSCGKIFLPHIMKSHMKLVHSIASFKCHDCGKSFKSKTYLKTHQISKHLKIKFACPYEGCGKLLSHRYFLKNHIELVHKTDVRHQCNQCEKSFKVGHDLKQHIKAVHEGKKVQCSFCEKEFVRPSEKNRHERQVHGDGSSKVEKKTDDLV